MSKVAKKKPKAMKPAAKFDCVTRSLTTDQLAQKAIKDIQQMSEEEKAKLRGHLSGLASSRGPKAVATEKLDLVTRSLIANGVQLTQRNWIEAAYMGDKHAIEEMDFEDLADAPENFEEWPEDELPEN
jgi:hypothetical protein